MYLSSHPATYWNHQGKHQAEYEALWAKLVPSTGMADTLAGEVLRCMAKIYYRHYNDGDTYTEDSFAFLIRHIGDFSSYDEMADKAVLFAMDEKNHVPNEYDSFDDLKFDWDEEPEEDEDNWDYDEPEDDEDDEDY